MIDPSRSTALLFLTMSQLLACHEPHNIAPVTGGALRDATIRVCKAEPWLSVAPKSSADFVYGVALGTNADEALERAKRQVAESIETTIRAAFEETARLSSRTRGTQVGERTEETQLTNAAKATVEQRLRECRARDMCRDQNDYVHSVVECSRKSTLERELQRAADEISVTAPHDGTILSVPGVESPNTITKLGEYAHTILSDRMPSGGSSAQIVPTSNWTPTRLAEAARSAGTKYLLRTEYRPAGQQRYRFSAYVQDATTLARYGTAASFETELEPWQLSLVSPLGLLEPGATGACIPRITSGINKADLSEGDEVRFTYTLCEASHVYLYDVWEDGHLILVSPNAFGGSGVLPEGAERELPDEASRRAGIRLVACPLPGKQMTRESYKLIFSPTPLDLPGTATIESNIAVAARGGNQGTVADLEARLQELLRRHAPISIQDVPFAIHAVPGSKSGCPK